MCVFPIRIALQDLLCISDHQFVVVTTAVKSGKLLECFQIKIAVVVPKLLGPVVVEFFKKIAPVESNRFDRRLCGAFTVPALSLLSSVGEQELELLSVNLVTVLGIQQICSLTIQDEVFLDDLTKIERLPRVRNHWMEILRDRVSVGIGPEELHERFLSCPVVATRGDMA